MASQAPCARCAVGPLPATPASSARRAGPCCPPPPRASRTLHRPKSTRTDVVDRISTTATEGSRAGALTEVNGRHHSEQTQNGRLQNGRHPSGQPTNGHLQDGKAHNGHQQNGQPLNGQLRNGQPQNGHHKNGHHQTGEQQDGDAATLQQQQHTAHRSGVSATARHESDQLAGLDQQAEAAAEKAAVEAHQALQEARQEEEEASSQSSLKDEQGVYHGEEDIYDMFAPIAKRLAGGKKVTHSQYVTFVQKLLDLADREKRFSGAMLSQALHRLAATREVMGYATPGAHTAFLILFARIGKTSRHMTTKEIALAVWAVVKFSTAEGYKLPACVSWREQSPGKKGSSTGSQATGDAQSASRCSPPESSAHGERVSSSVEHAFKRDDGAAQSRVNPDSASLLKRPEVSKQALERLRSNAQASSSSQPPPDSETDEAAQEEPTPKLLPIKAYDRLGYLASSWLKTHKDCDAASLSILLWSFAKLGHSPLRGGLFKFTQTRALPLHKTMNGQDVSNFLYAFGELNEPIMDDVLTVIAKRAIWLAKRGELTPISVAIIIQALARMRKSPLGGDMVQRLLFYLMKWETRSPNGQRLKQLTAQSMTNIWVGLSVLRHRPPPAFVDMWAEQCVRRVLEYSLKEARAIEHACQVMGLDPLDGKLLRVLRREHLRLRRSKSSPAGLSPVLGHPELSSTPTSDENLELEEREL